MLPNVNAEHNMNWQPLSEELTLEKIQEDSFHQPQVIFKHSTRCPISATAKSRFERSFQDAYQEKMQFYLIDLITYRSVSNAVASKWNIQHESPQVLVISDGKVRFHESHYGISWEGILSALS